MKRFLILLAVALVIVVLFFVGVAQTASAQVASPTWVGPGGVTWTIVPNLPPIPTAYNQPGLPVVSREPIDVPAVPNLEVRLMDDLPQFADVSVIDYSMDGGKTWKSLTPVDILPASWVATGEPAVNILELTWVDPLLPKIYISPSTSGATYPDIVGTYANGQWSFVWQKTCWDDSRSTYTPFDPKWSGVIYSDLAVNNPTDHLSLSDNSGNTWFPIPLDPALDGYTFLLENVVRDASESGTDLLVASLKHQTGSAGPSAVVFVPDSAIKNPTLMSMTTTTLTMTLNQLTLSVSNGATTQSVILDAAPTILGDTGRTFLPIRPVVEALGGRIYWNPNGQMVTITQGDNSVTLQIGNNLATIDGKSVPIDADPSVKPYISPPGRTMLPLRFIAQALGAQVNWDAVARKISIVYPDPAG